MPKTQKIIKKPTKGRVLCKVVREGVADEISGGTYYKNLLKKLRKAGASKSTIQAFKSSRRDEIGHRKKLVKLKAKVCK